MGGVRQGFRRDSYILLQLDVYDDPCPNSNVHTLMQRRLYKRKSPDYKILVECIPQICSNQ